MLKPVDLSFTEEMREPEFRIAMLSEALSELISGDLTDGLNLLRSFGETTDAQVTALGENPSARDLFQLIAALQRAEAATLQIRIVEPNEVELFDVPGEVHAAAA